MTHYEYKVVPAPAKGLKQKGVRGGEARFALALQETLNAMAGYGWEYQRAETLPSLERAGLTGTTTEWRNLLVFRRPRREDAEAFEPELLPAPAEAEAVDGDAEGQDTPAAADAAAETGAQAAPDAQTGDDDGKPG